jgi:hypothetical protein
MYNHKQMSIIEKKKKKKKKKTNELKNQDEIIIHLFIKYRGKI